ncbi:MAG: tol-pal system protein YbgF [Deltaproteobacteria bacterium]|nr:tol-pal system protein YbgF [Deltaproteobacteria bacterium]
MSSPAGAADEVEWRLADLERQVVDISQIREDMAEQYLTVLRLEEEVGQLKDLVARLQHQLDQLAGQTSLAERLRRIETKLADLETTRPTPGEEEATEPSQPPNEEEAYARAKELYKQHQMPQTRQALEDFIAEFPASNLVPAAKFWIGETFYTEQRYEEAILEYQKVIQDNPKTQKAASAMLKQAFAFAELKDPTSARVVLRRLVKDYPDSRQAEIARKKIATLK